MAMSTKVEKERTPTIIITLTYRYRIYPRAAQQQELNQWLDICRNAYNYGLRQMM